MRIFILNHDKFCLQYHNQMCLIFEQPLCNVILFILLKMIIQIMEKSSKYNNVKMVSSFMIQQKQNSTYQRTQGIPIP